MNFHAPEPLLSRNDTLPLVTVSTKFTQANKLDDLRAARGVVLAVGLSAGFWAPLAWVLS